MTTETAIRETSGYSKESQGTITQYQNNLPNLGSYIVGQDFFHRLLANIHPVNIAELGRLGVVRREYCDGWCIMFNSDDKMIYAGQHVTRDKFRILYRFV